MAGGLSVRYRLAPSEPGRRRDWMDSGRLEDDQVPWWASEGPVDLSASGVAFDGPPPGGQGDLLLAEIARPGAGSPLRAAARIVRILPAARQEKATGSAQRSAARRLALEFVETPAPVRQALLDLVVGLQRLPGEGEEEDPEKA